MVKHGTEDVAIDADVWTTIGSGLDFAADAANRYDLQSASFSPKYMLPVPNGLTITQTLGATAGIFEYDTTVVTGNIKAAYVVYVEDGASPRFNKSLRLEFRLNSGVLQFRTTNDGFVPDGDVDFSTPDQDPVTAYDALPLGTGSYTLDLVSIVRSAASPATEDVAYSYTVTASDADAGDTVTLTATTPGWLTFAAGTPANSVNATLTGTPDNDDVGGTHTVVITATDNGTGALTATQTFTITVANVNDAPVIAAQTFTVAENQTAVGTVVAADVDANTTLTYTIVGGDDASSFAITTAGVLSLNTAADFETKSSYTLEAVSYTHLTLPTNRKVEL